MAIQQLLQALAISNSPKFGPFFERMRRAFPSEVARICVQHIATHELGPAEATMVDWLSSHDAYIPALIGSDSLSTEEAQRAAKVLRAVDPRFFAKLSQFTDEKLRTVDTAMLSRALNLLGATGDCTALVPRLNALSNHADERIRSKAVKALCGLRPNRALLERQLQSEDPRVRANAIEGIWHMEGDEARWILRDALSDSHHRVVVNALVGLHYLDDESALDRLLKMANHTDAGFRSAVAWALGHIRDLRAIGILEVLANDTSDMVRQRAIQVLSNLPPDLTQSGIERAEQTTPTAEGVVTHAN